ncbi:MAG: S8 family serine peptidase, partial [Terriglobales bacterium]
SIEFVIQMKQQGLANARVISASWGDTGFSKFLLDQVNRAYANDILLVAAAGNQGSDNDAAPFYPASYDLPNVISVAATDPFDNLTSSSNFGATSVDLGAPGNFILSTNRGGGYEYTSGTSMATPFVSGTAALVLSVCPMLKPADLRATILESVDVLGSLSGKVFTGGRLNVENALGICNVDVFSLYTSPISQTVTQGATAIYELLVESRGGFEGLVNVGVSGLPSGAAGSFDLPVIDLDSTGSATATLTVTTSDTMPPGTYAFMIHGTDGVVSRTTPVWLVVARSTGRRIGNGNR